jgi:hypothetical protein
MRSNEKSAVAGQANPQWSRTIETTGRLSLIGEDLPASSEFVEGRKYGEEFDDGSIG